MERLLVHFYQIDSLLSDWNRWWKNLVCIYHTGPFLSDRHRWWKPWSWSRLFVSSTSSCVHLSDIKVDHLGSITSLEILKSKSIRNEFSCSCSFLAWLHVSGPWFVSFGRELVCTVGMSSSSSLSWKGVILDSSNPKNGDRSMTLKLVLTPYVLGRSISYALSLILRNTLNGPSTQGCNLLLRCSGKRSLRKCTQS